MPWPRGADAKADDGAPASAGRRVFVDLPVFLVAGPFFGILLLAGGLGGEMFSGRAGLFWLLAYGIGLIPAGVAGLLHGWIRMRRPSTPALLSGAVAGYLSAWIDPLLFDPPHSLQALLWKVPQLLASPLVVVHVVAGAICAFIADGFQGERA